MAQADPFATPRLTTLYGGAVPSPADPRDYQLPHLAYAAARAPGQVDLRDFQGQSLLAPVRDQGQCGSCVGHAWGALRASEAARYHILLGERPDLGDDISPRFIYDIGRAEFDHTYPDDSGLQMRSGGAVIDKYGVPPERYCPYTGQADNGPIAQEIDAAAYAAAKDYGLYKFYRIDGGGLDPVQAMIGALAELHCIVTAILVPPSYEQVGSTGRVPLPRPGAQVLGGHAQLCCGYYYDNSYPGGGCFVHQGSWGTSHGDGGYFYIPFAYWTTSSGRNGNWGQESWTLR